MRLDLRALRERIREAEAGGDSDTPLRRAYNHKLRHSKSRVVDQNKAYM